MQIRIVVLFATLLATLAVAPAHAVRITLAAASQTRVEGQSVLVNAQVDWEFTPAFNQYVTRSVTATLMPASTYPIEPDDSLPTDPVQLTYVEVTRGPWAPGSYQGSLAGLPSTGHKVRVTAVQHVTTITYGPMGQRTLSMQLQGQHSSDVSFAVLPRSDCFNFDAANGADGWTLKGLYDGWTTTLLSTTLPVSRQSEGFLGSAGSLRISLPRSVFASAHFTGDTWRVEIDSPPLDALPEWQQAAGVDLRVRFHWADQEGSAATVNVQPLLTLGAPSQPDVMIYQQDASNHPVLLPVFHDWFYQTYTLTMFDYEPRPGSTSRRLRLRFVGSKWDLPQMATLTQPYISIDNVCAVH